MVRINSMTIVGENAKYIEAAGVKGDTLPTGNFATGSSFLELDPENNAVKVYFYNEASGSWMAIGGDE